MNIPILPKHLAVIMDGNGRWAKAQGLPRKEGHSAGTKTAKALVTSCRELGIGHVTLYTFSKENWARPKAEIAFLFDLLVTFLGKELKSLMDQGIRLNILGELSEMPLATRKVIEHVMKKTAANTDMVLNLALNYSSRDEIARAMRAIAAKGIAPDDIDEQTIADHLYTAGQPDPDLIIRTSGELRLSNFLLFQSAYSEFYFTETRWPDFDEAELHKALEDFAGRDRRFGKTGEQTGQDT